MSRGDLIKPGPAALTPVAHQDQMDLKHEEELIRAALMQVIDAGQDRVARDLFELINGMNKASARIAERPAVTRESVRMLCDKFLDLILDEQPTVNLGDLRSRLHHQIGGLTNE